MSELQRDCYCLEFARAPGVAGRALAPGMAPYRPGDTLPGPGMEW